MQHVVTIGTFDGVHRGHQALVQRALARASQAQPAAKVAALVFDPNPIEVLRPGHAPPRLTTFDQKRELLLAAGAHEVHRLEPTPALLGESPEQFLREILNLHDVTGIVEGPDFHFGKGRAGDIRTLAELGPRFGFTVDVVDPVSVILNDHTIAPARSTMARWLLNHGRVSDAARVLGRAYAMRGIVIQGDRRGRTIGYPTTNLRSDCLAPADGVYAGRALLPDGRAMAAAISIGNKPTFGTHARAVEAFLFDVAKFDGPNAGWSTLDGLPEYGWTMDLEFRGWLRDQIRYDSLDALLEQIERDCRAIARDIDESVVVSDDALCR